MYQSSYFYRISETSIPESFHPEMIKKPKKNPPIASCTFNFKWLILKTFGNL